jgi:predicted neutral ceramidase superfamily lipid hydrolase
MLNNRQKLFEINFFSWMVLISYIFTFCFMHRFPWGSFSFESLYFSAPIILILIFWSQKFAHLIYLKDTEINKKQAFQRDIFIFNFSLLISFFLEMIINFKYSDTRTLWSILIYPFSLYGFIFSICYASILSFKKNHKTYSVISSGMLLAFFPLLEFLVSFPIFKNMGQFYASLCVSLGILFSNTIILLLSKDS